MHKNACNLSSDAKQPDVKNLCHIIYIAEYSDFFSSRDLTYKIDPFLSLKYTYATITMA